MNFDPAWEAEHKRREWGTVPDPDVVNFARQYFRGTSVPKDRYHIRLLDLGCGVGAQAYYLANEGYTVCGCDGSTTAIQRALDRRPHHTQNPSFQFGELTKLPYKDGMFDGVVDICALECLPIAEATKAMKEIARVLRPPGLLLSLTAADDCDMANHTIGHVRQSDDEELVKLYQTGFDVLLSRKRTHIDGFNREVKLWAIVSRKKP